MNTERQALYRSVLQPAPAAAAWLAYIALMLSAVMTGCASIRLDPLITDAVDVEPKDSPRARVATVQIRDHDGRLKVSGRLKKRHAGRSPIPGHLHIEALGLDGAVLGNITTGYRQLNPKAGISEFSQVLDIRPEQVRTVRVIHHDRDDDEDATKLNPQPDACRGTCRRNQTV